MKIHAFRQSAFPYGLLAVSCASVLAVLAVTTGATLAEIASFPTGSELLLAFAGTGAFAVLGAGLLWSASQASRIRPGWCLRQVCPSVARLPRTVTSSSS